VGNVEGSAVLSHSQVLRDDAFVLHRHLPAREGDHARAERDVAIVQRGLLEEGLHSEE
jgi:hypothetical protein